MGDEVADGIRYGTTVVGAILLFAAFVALFRRDLGDPYVAALTFATAGVTVNLLGRLPSLLVVHARRAKIGRSPR